MLFCIGYIAIIALGTSSGKRHNGLASVSLSVPSLFLTFMGRVAHT